jgi:aminomethyltransferase
MSTFQHTPLHSWHVSHGAKMTEFAGWDMPLHYGSILAEHAAVRQHGGVFDISHMTRIRVSGSDRTELLDALLPFNVKGQEVNSVGYSFFCDERGGIIDDITLYKADDYFLVVANGVNRKPVNEWLKKHREKYSVEIEDVTESLCMVAFQGPMAQSILQGMTLGELGAIRYYHFAVMQSCGARVLISRTGYTGEDGFEVYCGLLYVRNIWERILASGREAGVVPVGLGARDLLRLEAAMPLYGHELTLETTPLEAGLDKFVNFDKRAFLGRTALLHSTSSEFSRRLIGFEMLDNSVPRPKAQILFEGMPIGVATRAAFSPTLKKGIGMGYVDGVRATVGSAIEVEIHGKTHPARIVKRPFYRRPRA